MKLVSLIIPVFNEAESIFENVQLILEKLPKSAQTQFEVILVDDGSTDKTIEKLEPLCHRVENFSVLSFTRNFGKESAILAGLTAAKGDAAVVMDSDLQHPPELIEDMIQHWMTGFKIVEAVKQNRGKERTLTALGSRGFYLILEQLAGLSLTGHSDFKLLDREVINAYLNLPEKHKFFRGLIQWMGYPSVQIPFSVPERKGSGGSRWSDMKLVRYAFNNITMLSSVPLRMVSGLGVLTLTFGFIFGAISLWQKFSGVALTGFTTVNLLIIVLGGAILLSLGIIGHYLALLFDEIKARPPFIIRKKFDKDGSLK